MDISEIKALTFDVFATVVDWRSGIIREGEALGRKKGLDVDWAAFAHAWWDRYRPAMDKVRAGLPWDAILGADVARHYKPDLECYLKSADCLGLRPEDCMMVAAHNGDLAAKACGFRAAFVYRRDEHGPGQTEDLEPAPEFDVVAEDVLDLAGQLGC